MCSLIDYTVRGIYTYHKYGDTSLEPSTSIVLRNDKGKIQRLILDRQPTIITYSDDEDDMCYICRKPDYLIRVDCGACNCEPIGVCRDCAVPVGCPICKNYN